MRFIESFLAYSSHVLLHIATLRHNSNYVFASATDVFSTVSFGYIKTKYIRENTVTVKRKWGVPLPAVIFSIRLGLRMSCFV